MLPVGTLRLKFSLQEYSQEWMKEVIFADNIPLCESCRALVKPDIIFFGESLPDRFQHCVSADFSTCDLLIIMGTSLVVQVSFHFKLNLTVYVVKESGIIV